MFWNDKIVFIETITVKQNFLSEPLHTFDNHKVKGNYKNDLFHANNLYIQTTVNK